MTTKTIVIGDDTHQINKLKTIEFHLALGKDSERGNIKMVGIVRYPKEFAYIELISKNYIDGLDLMFAYNSKDFRTNGVLYIGKWNNGVI